jgi:hypothetical protein
MVTIIFPTAKLKSAHWPFCLVGFRGACSALVSTSCPERPWKPSPTKTFHSTVQGKTTYEQQMAAIRGAATPSIQ